MNALIVVARKNRVDEIYIVSENALEGRFLSVCHDVFSNFTDYTKKDIDAILEKGYEMGNDCAVCMYQPHREVDESKFLVVHLNDNILDDVTIFDSKSEARDAFVYAAKSLDYGEEKITKPELKKMDYRRVMKSAVEFYTFPKD